MRGEFGEVIGIVIHMVSVAGLARSTVSAPVMGDDPEAGCSEATIAELMGRSDLQTTRRYTHATDRAKRAAVEAVSMLREEICHNARTAARAGSRKWLIKMV